MPWDAGGSVPFENDKWELYDLSKDFSQHDDLAATNPDKLKELQAVFETEGKKFGVFPLDDRLAGRLDVSLRPSWTSSRNKFTYYYDFFGYNDYKIESTALPTGKVQLQMDFKYDGGGAGKGGTVTLSVNGKEAGVGRVGKTIPGRYGMDTFDIGMDLNAPVVRSGIYKTPYEFTGTIDSVTVELKN